MYIRLVALGMSKTLSGPISGGGFFFASTNFPAQVLRRNIVKLLV